MLAQILDRIKNILLSPKSEFAAVKTDGATIQQVYKDYAIFVAALPAIGTILSFGSFLGFGMRFKMAVVSYLIMLGSFYVSAHIVNYLAPNFGSTKDLTHALKLVVYASTPSMVAGLFAFLGGLSGLLSLAGLIYGIYLFYLGMPIFMDTPSEKVITYMVAAFLVSLIVYFLLSWILLPIFGLSIAL